MKNILTKAQADFRTVQTLLTFPEMAKNDYFTQLSIATEEAYFTMNSGMCSHVEVCKNCLKNRDFIRSMMDVLGELEVNSTGAEKYQHLLLEYLVRVTAMLERISSFLSVKNGSRLTYGLPL